MRAVILPTVEEQVAAGDTIIDPEKLIFDETKHGPVFFEGRYDVPEAIVGRWSNMRVEDGQLVADIDLKEGPSSRVNHFSPAAMRAPSGEARLIAVHGAYAPCKDDA